MLQILKDRAVEIGPGVKKIDAQELTRIRETVGRMAELIPEASLMGGEALRVLLDYKGLPVPQEFGGDFDYAIPKANYDQIRKLFPVKGSTEPLPQPKEELPPERARQIQSHYRRKGDKEQTPFGVFNFMKEPERALALEDNLNKAHIDLVVRWRELVTETITYHGHRVSILSPEELFLKRADEVEERLEDGRLQRRHVVYFYFNSLLVSEKEIDKLWSGSQGYGEITHDRDWRKFLTRLDEQVQEAEKQGKIIEKVVH
jgi:hypothetical protein